MKKQTHNPREDTFTDRARHFDSFGLLVNGLPLESQLPDGRSPSERRVTFGRKGAKVTNERVAYEPPPPALDGAMEFRAMPRPKYISKNRENYPGAE